MTPESGPRMTVHEGLEPGPQGADLLTPTRVDKPWGHEVIWAHSPLYVGKLLFVRAGEALSLQFHEEKDETLHLLEGELALEVGPGIHALRSVELEAGRSIRLRPGTLHRMEAITDCTLLEASTPELDDVVRVRDRYGRAPAPEGDSSPRSPADRG